MKYLIGMGVLEECDQGLQNGGSSVLNIVVTGNLEHDSRIRKNIDSQQIIATWVIEIEDNSKLSLLA